MPWVEVFVVFVVSHLVGDFMLQTEWQALHKHGGLGGSPEMRRALVSHVATYTLAFVPALIWLWGSLGAGVFGVAALIAIPHLIQDDGRLLSSYARTFKKTDLAANPVLGVALDQSFHLLALFLVALLAGT
jgi:fatty acid desaturase